MDTLLEPVGGFGGKESALRGGQAALAVLGQPQADIGVVQNVLFVTGKPSGATVIQPGNGFICFNIAVAVHVTQFVGGSSFAQHGRGFPIVVGHLLIALYTAAVIVAIPQVAHGG